MYNTDVFYPLFIYLFIYIFIYLFIYTFFYLFTYFHLLSIIYLFIQILFNGRNLVLTNNISIYPLPIHNEIFRMLIHVNYNQNIWVYLQHKKIQEYKT